MTGQGAPPKLSAEALADLKVAVREKLRHLGVDDEIRRVIAEKANTGFSKQQAMDALQERGLISQLAESLGDPEAILQRRGQAGSAPPEGEPGRRYLSVRIRRGRGFVAHGAGAAATGGGHLEIHVELFGQRFRSSPARACPEPEFDAFSLVELPGKITTDPLDLVTLRHPMSLVVVRNSPATPSHCGDESSGDSFVGRSVLGHCEVEWRKVLAASSGQRLLVTAEIMAAGGRQAGLPLVGCVDIVMELVPPLAKATDAAVLRRQLQTEGESDTGRIGAFATRARSWWASFVSGRPDLRERLVKVLAVGQDGLQRPVCGYVRPLQPGRLLSTPREAARWVSLLGKQEEQAESAIFGGAWRPSEAWAGLHSILSSGSASKEERATLLCGLLLGFGLDAWVAIGRDSNGGHMWVVTFSGKALTFWEPATGERFDTADFEAMQCCPYQLVDCLFNHLRLYANLQENNAVGGTLFHLHDASLWAELKVQGAEVPGPSYLDTVLQRNLLDVVTAETQLEASIRRTIEKYRWNVLGLSETPWSDGLSYLIMPALAAYEQEAVTGQPAGGNEEFSAAVKLAVPAGFMFKGFPKHFCHLQDASIGNCLVNDATVQSMLSYHSAGCAFGLRAKVFPYPADLLSVWVMLCLKHPV